MVLCPFHADRTGSLSVDLEAGVFNCFGCGARGGYKKFAELVGEERPRLERRPRSPRSPMVEARREVLRAGLAQTWNDDAVRLRYEACDALRLADRVRRAAAETETGWELLMRAAALTTAAEAVLADLVA